MDADMAGKRTTWAGLVIGRFHTLNRVPTGPSLGMGRSTDRTPTREKDPIESVSKIPRQSGPSLLESCIS